ncbi:stage II sporulation protein M [Motilibacter rhizosphaerae]|uniref:Stage II sporulation protein M n=1 Tax=Motilibacter rhizosphaerae TaxID=598652 RepID=A0A4Q7NSN0_9ACTN|nr:stage II sporulation protein M [Motilibacter rhizosphaerae]RZS90146.1 stage II sporulation protein M [Motilibacter rhizosphaerae]
MDLEAYAAAHRGEWERLDALARRRHLAGAEVDELVELYQRAGAHLAAVQAAAPDPALVGRLSSLVARGRAAVAGGPAPSWRALGRFFAVVLPAALWRARWWVGGASLGSLVVIVAAAVWVARDAQVAATVVPAGQLPDFRREFVDYYSQSAHGSFAFKVWTNNAWVAAQCLLAGISLVFPVWVLLQNAADVGVSAGLLARDGQLGTFLVFISPHGLLELTSVFTAAGTGLRLGWTLVDPGPRTRSAALAVEGRAMGAVALGLVPVFAVAGTIEGFVTPSGLPAAVKVGVGVVAWAAFLAYAGVLGSRAARAGTTGDLEQAPAVLPTAG